MRPARRPTLASPRAQEQDEPASAVELTVLLPCLDEARTIESCIATARAALAAAGAQGEILVADNGSTDPSVALALAAGARVIHVVERGYGNALAAGIAAARGRYVLMADADGSYDLRQLPDFLLRLRAGADLVMGCRLPRGGGSIERGAMPWKHRWIGNPVLSAIGRLFFNSPLHDFHCGMRAGRREALLALKMRCPGMEFASEMVVKATLQKLVLAEVPVTLRPDGRGRPPHLRSFRDGWRHLRFMLLFAPHWLFLAPAACLGLLSLGTFAALLPGPVTLGGVTFDTNTLLVAAVGLLTALQTALFGILSQTFAVDQGLLPASPIVSALRRVRPVELGLALGAILLATGLAWLLVEVDIWRRKGFGDLSYPDSLRMVIPAVTALALGVQLIFAGFALAMLELSRDIRLRHDPGARPR